MSLVSRILLQLFLSLAVFHDSIYAVESCVVGQVWMQGRDIVAHTRPQLLLVAFLNEQDKFLFDRCGRLSRLLQLPPSGDISQVQKVVKDSLQFAVCGWCEYDLSRTPSPKSPSTTVQIYAYVHDHSEHSQGRHHSSQAVRRPVSLMPYPLSQPPRHLPPARNPSPPTRVPPVSSFYSHHTSYITILPENTPRGPEHVRNALPHISPQQYPYRSSQTPSPYSPQAPQTQQFPYTRTASHPSNAYQSSQRTYQQDFQDPRYQRAEQKESRASQPQAQTNPVKSRGEELEERNRLLREREQRVREREEWLGRRNVIAEEATDNQSKRMRKPFEDDEKWKPATSLYGPDFVRSGIRPTIPTSLFTADYNPEEYDDYGLMSTSLSSTHSPAATTQETQIPSPSLWEDVEEDVPCHSVKDDFCYLQRKEGRQPSKCCRKGVYLADYCVVGKCSNTTIQACCIQKFLQSRYECCADESMKTAPSSDSFSRCCHNHFVTSEDDCCPLSAAQEYWNTVNDICLPNVYVDLSHLKIQVRLGEDTRTLDLAEREKWDHPCKYGGNRPQYVYYP